MKESKQVHYRKVGKYNTARKHVFNTAILPKKEIVVRQITLKVDGTLIIDKFYAWDGPSGPTKWIASKLYFKWLKRRFLIKFMRGSLAHDGLFELFRSGKLDHKWFHQANKEMRRICREDGMGWFRRKYTFFAVDKFAQNAASEKNKRKVLIAP